MTQRERTMATVLGAAAVLAVGAFGFWTFQKAIASSQQNIVDLKIQVAEAEAKIFKVQKEGPLLERWKRMSLVGDPEKARAVYRDYLKTLIKKHGLQEVTFPGGATADSKSSVIHPTRAKTPIYYSLGFVVKFKGNLLSMVTFLRDFQSEPTMHRIKQIYVERDGKSETQLVAQATFEALMILDAEKDKGKPVTTDGRFVVMDTLAALTNSITGLGSLRWTIYANSPQSPVVAPLNPLHTARNYGDIVYRNPFTFGKGPEEEKNTGTPTVIYPDSPPDDVINMMRFTHFGHWSQAEGEPTEARLWDAWNNETKRVKTTPGFSKFPLLQTGPFAQFAKIIQGNVVKIENSDIIYRVGLQASDATYVSSKWWRYPPQHNFYTIHDEDFQGLLKSGKVREDEKDTVYVIPQVNWDRMIRKDSEKLTLISGGPTFRVLANGSVGDVILTDKEVTVVRLRYEPPDGANRPTIPYSRFYPDPKTIYYVNTKHFSDLVTDKNLPNGRTVLPGDIERIYVMRTAYWDELWYHHRVLKQEGNASTFKFYGDLIGGEILRRTEGETVTFRIWEQYCHCKEDTARKIEERWHEGFLMLHIDENVADSLYSPLPADRLSEFLKKGAALDKR